MPGRRFLCGALALALLAACAPVPTEWYRLVAIPGRPHNARAGRIELRDAGLARYLDRPELVYASGTRLALSGNHRWAGPLDDMIMQVLADNLGQRLPASLVMREPGTLAGAPDCVVAVAVDRFEADGAGRAMLSAQYAIRRPDHDGPVAGHRVVMTMPAGTGPDALAQALSEALARLSDRIAADIAAPESAKGRTPRSRR